MLSLTYEHVLSPLWLPKSLFLSSAAARFVAPADMRRRRWASDENRDDSSDIWHQIMEGSKLEIIRKSEQLRPRRSVGHYAEVGHQCTVCGRRYTRRDEWGEKIHKACLKKIYEGMTLKVLFFQGQRNKMAVD